MCAIAGFIGYYMDEAIARKILKTMERRGPDDRGAYHDGLCTLFHTRLTIIDPKGGAQPMYLRRGKERFVISYNGELYNTEEVRQKLRETGHEFASYSDTEVVLHAYAQWGEACLDVLNGIFAFAVWEEHSGRLFLARDRMGVKPLFYRWDGEGLIFASEIKTILAYPGVEARLDAAGAGELILLGPGRTPGSGVFQGIREIRPGWCGYFQNGKLTEKQYWRFRDREHKESFEETAQHVRELVLDSVRRQMVSDVPIGTFLSGGLDSSLISAICAKEYASQGRQLQTFSLDYQDNARFFQPDQFQPSSDNAYIEIMEKDIASRQHWTVLSPEQLVGALEDATRARDLPGMADVDFSLLVFCGEIRKNVKVALSGECADEIFGGYPWYRDPKVRDTDGFPWAQNTALRSTLLCPEHVSRLTPEDFVMDRYRETARQADVLPGCTPLERRMKEMMQLNYSWFMQTLLDRKDRMSMYHGLEVRVPFCDYRIAEYLYAVPWEYKDYQGKEKGLLRKAMTEVIPSEVLYRKKSPYPKTWDPKYLDLVRTMLEGVLEDKNDPLFQVVSREAVLGILDRDTQWPWYGQLMRRPQLLAFLLQIRFWLKEYRVSVI